MKIKKLIVLGSVIVTLGATLTGCGTKENEVKSIDKENATSSINLQQKTDDVKKEENTTEIKNNENTTSEKNPETEKNTEAHVEKQTESKNTTQTQDSTENRVIKVDYSEIYPEDGHYIIIHGYDENANIVWEYKSINGTVAQFSSLEYIGEHWPQVGYGLVYLNELGTIKALDYQTGNVVWTNSEYKGGQSISRFDTDGNLYMYSMQYEQKLCVIDKNGKITKTIDIDEYEKNAPKDVCLPTAVYGGEMEVVYKDGKPNRVEISYSFPNTQEKNGKSIDVEVERMLTISLIDNSINVKILNTKEIEF